jgi:LmbE family N-acetylglucosaminyl deacetylase
VAVGVAVLAALAIQYRIHLANEWQQHVPLPAAVVHGRGDRVIVFAPHSDDETLGCGGMLATSLANGADVRVVLITNGDGFRIAVGRAYNTLHVTPQRCIQFAYRRQKETLRALETLGVSDKQVTFLGYPDRGIDQLWNKYWSPEKLFVSRATHADHSPYRNSFTRGAAYCGESLLSDIEKVIRADKPTDVYLPHPCDNHPDHYATYCFVASALEQLRAEGIAKTIRVHTYLVHRGDWPTPKGDHPEEPLAPPYGLARSGTKWYSLALSPNVAERKRRAIKDYITQVDVERGFMMSFARRNEIFGDVPIRQVLSVGPSTIKIDGDPDDWSGIPPAILDAVGDYVMAGLNRGGDVRTVYLCSDDKFLYVRVDCVRHLSKRITYSVNFRGLGASDANDHYSLSIRLKSAAVPPRTIWAAKNNTLEIAIPLGKLNFDRNLFVQVQTKLMNLTVDNTGWQEVEFGR